MIGLSASIRVGLPSPGDPEGATGPGSWWLTGGCRPAYLWERADRPPRHRSLARFVRAGLRPRRLRDGRRHGAARRDDEADVSGAGE